MRRSALLLACLASFAQAAAFPPAVELDGKQLTLNGSALRTVWGFKVYRVGLFLAEPATDADHIMNRDRAPKRIHMVMLRAVTNAKFTATVRENIDHNLSTADKEKFATELAAYLGYLEAGGDLEPGSEITIDYIPNRGMVLAHDGEFVGTIPGDEFYHLMLRLWIGQPLQPSIKTGLLGATASGD